MANPFLSLRDWTYPGYELKYFPAKVDKGHPFALICPGGGYSCVMSSVEGAPVAKALNALGIPAFVLRYRTGKTGRCPVPMDDLARAVREILDGNGPRWQVETKGYSVWGVLCRGTSDRILRNRKSGLPALWPLKAQGADFGIPGNHYGKVYSQGQQGQPTGFSAYPSRDGRTQHRKTGDVGLSPHLRLEQHHRRAGSALQWTNAGRCPCRGRGALCI